MDRRRFMISTALGSLAAGVMGSSTRADELDEELAWTDKHGLRNNMRVDADPLDKTFEKYPTCPYCGMSISRYSHTMHLIQYDDDRSEATCSLHCASLSLALNMDRGPKHIWVGDAGASAQYQQRPLVKVDEALYVIDPSRPGTMSGSSKLAFSNVNQAQMAAAASGGFIVNFDQALRTTYNEMTDAMIVIRQRRAERRARKGQPGGAQ